MRKIRNIECKYENCVKIKNIYVCIKCNRKLTQTEYEKRKNDT